ncbi:MAG: UvrD-helicase domain-containing protein [Syntrophales bacterium]|nr:UvrD-helicase domain-containing protein [Syntrophales bacterium]
MIDYEKELNPEQRDVVQAADGPILVIAGAGSGKTRALTYRVAHLIEQGADPGHILLATFTNKAARSMLSRVDTLVDVDLGRLWGGTFHHVGNRILRRHAGLLGYERSYSIVDSEDSRQLLNTCIRELGIHAADGTFPKPGVVGDIISLSSNTGVAIETIIEGRYRGFSRCITDILKVALRYRIRKKELSVMDFDDILLNWCALLTDFPDVRDEYAHQFRHILVDEYQDTNIIQAQILDLLAARHRNLMVVGDDSQSIYSFRGANFANIVKFPEKYPDAKVFKLETNYRSTPEILHLANMSIVNNRQQFEKELKAVRRKGVRPVFVPVRNVLQQADFVAQRIIELVDEGTPLGEIAVLYRAHYHSMELQMELVRRGVPFEIRSGIRFFEQAHIKDVTAFMRIAANPLDEIAWKRVMKLYQKIGEVTARKIWEFVSSQEDPLAAVFSDEFIKQVPKAAGIGRFRATLGDVLELSASNSLTEIVGVILNGGYRDYMEEKYGDGASREEDLKQLSQFSSEFETLEGFLSDLALMTNITEEEPYQPEENKHKIVLSSIHQAKGLEWSVVFMIWCSEGMIPLARALKEPGGEDEERRLFYVATTRAKDQLYFCHPLVSRSRGVWSGDAVPSRFIAELAPSDREPEDLPFDQWVIR